MHDTDNVDMVKRIMRQLSNVICKFKDLTTQIGHLLCSEERLADAETNQN